MCVKDIEDQKNQSEDSTKTVLVNMCMFYVLDDVNNKEHLWMAQSVPLSAANLHLSSPL